MTEKTDLFAKGGLEKPSQEDGEDAEEEGEYGGEEETPPFPLLQALLLPEDGDAIRRRGLHHQLNDLPSLWNKQIMPIMAIMAMATTEVSQVHEEEHPVTQRTLGVNSDLKMIFNSFFERTRPGPCPPDTWSLSNLAHQPSGLSN